jgi:hypothetical protein
MAREMFHVKQSGVGFGRETFHVEHRSRTKPDHMFGVEQNRVESPLEP